MAKKKSKPGASAVQKIEPPVLRLSLSNKDNARQPRLQTLLDGYLWILPDFLSPSECQEWINYMEASGPTLLEQRATRRMASRSCWRHSVQSPSTAQALFQRLPVPNAVACNPNIRLYKYTKGQCFGAHVDESNEIAGVGRTFWTALVYLSDCGGGATRFQQPLGQGEIAFAPQVGTLLLHLHGDDCLVHSADAVTSGVKYVLRTDVVCRDG